MLVLVFRYFHNKNAGYDYTYFKNAKIKNNRRG
jgi:hypothetical protein